jgi:hypothetical protein
VYPLFVSLHLAYPISISPVCPPRPGPYGAAQEVERITQVADGVGTSTSDVTIKDLHLSFQLYSRADIEGVIVLFIRF